MELSDSSDEEDIFDNKRTQLLEEEDDDDDLDEDIDEVLGLNPKSKPATSRPAQKKAKAPQQLSDDDSEDDEDDLISLGLKSVTKRSRVEPGLKQERSKATSREELMSEIYGTKRQPGRKRKTDLAPSTAPSLKKSRPAELDNLSTTITKGNSTTVQSSKAGTDHTIVLSDSDEDDLNFVSVPIVDEPFPSYGSGDSAMPAAVIASLQMARESQAIANRLRHSDPLSSPIANRSAYLANGVSTTSSSSTRPSSSPSSGAVLLSITCPLTNETIKFKILQTQPFSLLLNEYIKKKRDLLNSYFTKHNMTEFQMNHKKLLDDGGFIIKFDGMPVKPSQTPQDFAMLDQEVLQLSMPPPPTAWLGNLEKEVGIRLPERSVRSPPPTSSRQEEAEDEDEEGEFVIIRLRREGLEEKFRINRSNQFQKLHETYCQKKQLRPDKVKFIFDGLPLNMRSTPEDQDMEDDDLVDVEVQPGAQMSVRAGPPQPISQSGSSSAAREPKKPMVELDDADEGDYVILRVRRDTEEDKFRIKRTDPFKKLLEAYCKKKGLRVDRVKFTFDGLVLKANQTPDSQDMEDEDIIDVEQ